jgi:dipeptidyl aminopeptidase/acylaminoacyl peptidase
MWRFTCISLIVFVCSFDTTALGARAAAPEERQSFPTIDALISLKRADTAAISPDGTRVAFVIRETNWDENAFETEIWMADSDGARVRQLTNAARSSASPAWSPDGNTLAFVSDRSGRRQIYTIAPDGGEAVPVTSMTEPVGAFEWSPDGSRIAFTARDPIPDALKTRLARFGEFDVIDEDHRMTHLYVVDVRSRQVRRLTTGPFVVGGFEWSPAGAAIAFDHTIDSDPNNNGSADISIVNVASGEIRTLVRQPSPDLDPHWSPDGSRIVFHSAMGDPTFTYGNRRLGVIPADGGVIENLTEDFDENPILVDWKPTGIFFTASQRTSSYLFRLNPASKRITQLAPSDASIGRDFTMSRSGDRAAFIDSEPSMFPEVSVLDVPSMHARQLTNLRSQTSGWAPPTREVIAWVSKDGTPIEGVLHKPYRFEVGKRRPLLVIVHGGPTGTSRPIPFSTGSTGGLGLAYPIELWLAKGALVLEPNYRGSTGYGERFRSLNVRNLGIGDAWDVLSGVDHLVQSGIADPDRVGVMGWSQGGFIAAFLAAHDGARFRAVSVGAGISNWTTNYVNTDIHRFTRQYLLATPWDDPEIYARTSPITYLSGARAPVLIQHGATDQRVALANAFELYQGLQDKGVTSTLIVYKGFDGLGHVPSKPKSSRALMEHNLEWFDRYLFSSEPAPVARKVP